MLPPSQEPCKHGYGCPEIPRGRPSSRRLTRQDSRPPQGRGSARRKNRKPAAQPLPTAQAPTEGARSGGRVPPALSSLTLRSGVSARGATAGNDGWGIQMRTFAEVAARSPVRPRGGRESMRGAGGGDGARTATNGKGRTAGGWDTREKNVLGLPRPPRCAAVLLTVRDGSVFSYREAMSIAMRETKLSEFDIKEPRLRKAVTGAMLFEISGQDAGSEASRLAERMAATLKELPVMVTMPRRTAKLTMTGWTNRSPRRRWRPVLPRPGAAAPTRSVWNPYATLLGATGRCGYAARISGQENQQRRGRPIGRQDQYRLVNGEGYPSAGSSAPVLQLHGAGSRAQGLQVGGRPVGALLSMRRRRTSRQGLLGAST